MASGELGGLAMRDILSDRPLVVYGLKPSPVDHDATRHFIVFNCIVPGELVRMKSSAYLVFRYGTDGYELSGDWERRARSEGDDVYRLAHALQHTRGLYWLYILPTGFVAKGEAHMAAEAPHIIPKMRQALADVCGDIQFEEVPARELWIPSIASVESAKTSGVLLPP